MAAVKEDGTILEYASEELRRNREIVKQAVKQDGFAICYTSEELQDDKEIVMLALGSSSKAFEYASLRLKKDRDVVFKAVSNGYNISFIDKSFKNDRELILMSAKINGYATLEFACSRLKKDKEIVLQSVQQSESALFYASNELKNNREFVKEIVEKYGQCLGYTKQEFKDDVELVELAVKSSPDVFYNISSRKRRDFEFISNLIGTKGFGCLPVVFSGHRQIVLESIKLNPFNLTRSSMKLQNDKEFILQVVKNCGMAYKFIKEEFKTDSEIIMEAITQNGDALQFIPTQYFDNDELVIKAAQTATNIHSCFEKFSDRLKSDREFIMKYSFAFFNSLPRKYQLDREIVMQVVKTNPEAVTSKSYQLIVSYRVLAMIIVKRNGLLLGKLPFKYRNDREIVSFAIQQNKEAFKFISDELQNEFEFNSVVEDFE